MKKNIDLVRVWKDAAYRNSLSTADLAGLPANPAGALSDDDLEVITGGAQAAEATQATHKLLTLGCCRVTAGIFCGR